MEELLGYLDGPAVKMGGYVAGSLMRILLRLIGLGLQANWSLSRRGIARKTDTPLTKENEHCSLRLESFENSSCMSLYALCY